MLNNFILTNRIKSRLEKLELLLNGGKGSGNFGHSGRPGKVGGSGKTGRSLTSKEARHRASRRFAGIVHPELAYIVAANLKGKKTPLEQILKEPAIQKAIEESKFDKDTLAEFKGNKDRKKLQDELADRLLDNSKNGSYVPTKPKKKRHVGEVEQGKEAYIVIGRLAGGKSKVYADPLSQEHKARVIDSDIVKEWLPEFNSGYGAGRVQEESSLIMEKALKKAINKGENIIIPKVGGQGSIEKIAKDLKAKGYTVHLKCNTIPASSSVMRAVARFAEEGRWLSPSYLDSVGNKAEKTFKALANNKDLFASAEIKSNDVPYGRKPVTLWKSGDSESKLDKLKF